MAGLFEKLFDFNGDEKIDTFEKTAEFAAFADIMDGQETAEKAEELEMAGLDVTDLEVMDEEERREALEDAGLDPDEFDF
ncbi:MAG: hypothetical protein RR364_08075 [Lachnospiraceae bacterium]